MPRLVNAMQPDLPHALIQLVTQYQVQLPQCIKPMPSIDSLSIMLSVDASGTLSDDAGVTH